MNSITNTQLELIILKESAKEVIDKLDQNYFIKRYAVQFLCKKLLDLKMEEKENPTVFYNKFEKLVNVVNDAGEKVTKEKNWNIFC